MKTGGYTDQVRSFLLEHQDTTYEVSALAKKLSLERADVAGALNFLAHSDPRVVRVKRGVYKLDSSVPAEQAYVGGLMESRYRIAEAIALSGGVIEDSSGRATKILFDSCSEYGGAQAAMSGLMASMENDQLIEREKNARRVYRIELTEKGWLTFGLTALRPEPPSAEEPEPEAEPEPEVAQEAPAPPPPPPATNPLDDAFALLIPALSEFSNRDVIAEIFDALVDEMTRNSRQLAVEEVKGLYQATIDDLGTKLAQQHDRCRTLEERNRVLTDERDRAKDLVQAKIVEVRGLRDRAETAESNLRTVTQDRNKAQEVEGAEFRDLDRMVRERPHVGATQT